MSDCAEFPLECDVRNCRYKGTPHRHMGGFTHPYSPGVEVSMDGGIAVPFELGFEQEQETF